MVGLSQFFDFKRFCDGKRFITTAVKPWMENDQNVGTVVSVAIIEDKTPYKPGKDGKAISNLFEKMNWKIARNINIPIGVQVEAVDGVATVFGQYRNQLSARVADIKVLSSSAPPASGHATGGKGLN